MTCKGSSLRESRRAERRYEQMLQSSAIAAICAGPDNLIVSWNAAAEQLLGYSAQRVIGKPLSIIIPARFRSSHNAGFARAVETGRTPLAGQSVEIQAMHASGEEIPIELSLSMWFEAGQPMFGALLRDITSRVTAQRQLCRLAHYDTLTSLHNRNALLAFIAAEISKAPCSLLLLDLDGFKYVNDSLGHPVGDELLTAVAARLSRAVGTSGFLARLGGDEFAILIPDCDDPLRIDKLTSEIFSDMRPHFELRGQSIYVGTSIGIATSPRDASDVDQLVSSADLALYTAKSDGGGLRTFFTRAMQNTSEQRMRLSVELRQALANDEFELLYQPQVSLTDHTLLGVEALLRWRHPSHGLLAPQIFLSVLEESVIAEEVGDWVLQQACATAADWKRAGLGSLRVGVNLFRAQLRSDRLFSAVSLTLSQHGICASQLEIEITENTVLGHDNKMTETLKRLRALGVGIAFDDFGTGFASLSLLQKYPLSRLKIDRSFIDEIDRDAADAAIVKAVIAMARSLGLTVIAEGVETAAQEAALVCLGCDEAQGYRYGRPMSAAAIAKRYLSARISKETVSFDQAQMLAAGRANG